MASIQYNLDWESKLRVACNVHLNEHTRRIINTEPIKLFD